MKKVIRRLIIIAIVLIVLFCGLIGYMVYRELKEEAKLNDVVSSLLDLDLTEDNIDTTIVTTGDYSIVEKVIKNYLKDYSNNCKDFIGTIDNFDFANMFTADTFKNDGPDFLDSKGKLSKLKDTINTDLDKLIEMSSSDYIMELINKEKLDDYYVDLYKEYMLGEDTKSFDYMISDSIKDLTQIKEDVNTFLDDCYNLYDFMSSNRSHWYVEGEIVYFDTDKLVNEYNALLNKIIIDSNVFNENDTDEKNNDNNNIGSV